MEKSNIESFITACKNAGIEEYGFRHNGGSRSPKQSKDAGVMVLQGDNMITLERNVNFGAEGPFTVTYIPVEDIMFFYASDLPVQSTIKLLEELGVWNNSDMQEFVKAHGTRTRPIANNAGLDVMRDENGEVTISEHIPGYITK